MAVSWMAAPKQSPVTPPIRRLKYRPLAVVVSRQAAQGPQLPACRLATVTAAAISVPIATAVAEMERASRAPCPADGPP